MHYINNPRRNMWPDLVKRPQIDTDTIKPIVEQIFHDVRNRGDEALREFSRKFDGVLLDRFIVSESEIKNSAIQVPSELRNAIHIAIKNITKFHEHQRNIKPKIEIGPGVSCWQKNVAIERVGLYVPGGTAPLFSSLLMLAIPALIAGCTQINVCTPPDRDGKVNDIILYCADILGLKNIFKVGGAQAIAAMTYGTESIPAVDKIFGPGNQYVTMAKQIASLSGVAIDLPAGPSEVLVLTDNHANPEFVAADLLSQAEHGPDSQVILISGSSRLIDSVQKAITGQLQNLPRRSVAEQALQNSIALSFSNEQDTIDFINSYAPEHLILMLENSEEIAEKVINAGSVFLGYYTPEAAGDYASGTNHTLPTNGYARNHSGVSLDSFYKKITYQKITLDGLLELGPHIETMAEAEKLFAHKYAVSVRRNFINSEQK